MSVNSRASTRASTTPYLSTRRSMSRRGPYTRRSAPFSISSGYGPRVLYFRTGNSRHVAFPKQGRIVRYPGVSFRRHPPFRRGTSRRSFRNKWNKRSKN